MKVRAKRESTKLAENAINRAAMGVLGKAVRDKESIPLWDGNKVVWKIPKEEFEQLHRR
jgi:hypothetical protein